MVYIAIKMELDKWIVRKAKADIDSNNNPPDPQSCWKVGSYLPMFGALHCSMRWFPPPMNLFLMNSRALNHVGKLVVTCRCLVVYSAVCAGFLHLPNLFLMNRLALNEVGKLVVTCRCLVVYSAVCVL